MNFDAQDYANTVRIAGNAFRNSEKNSNKWAQESLAALKLDKLSLHAIALALYTEMKPQTAKGKDAAPKERDNGTISVSSLRRANGGEAAVKAFNALQYVAENEHILPDAVTDFAVNGGKLFSLVSSIKAEKAKQAKADSEETLTEQPTVASEGEEDASAPSISERITEFNAWLASVDVDAIGDSEQLALMQTIDTIGAISEAKEAETAPVAVNG